MDPCSVQYRIHTSFSNAGPIFRLNHHVVCMPSSRSRLVSRRHCTSIVGGYVCCHGMFCTANKPPVAQINVHTWCPKTQQTPPQLLGKRPRDIMQPKKHHPIKIYPERKQHTSPTQQPQHDQTLHELTIPCCSSPTSIALCTLV